MDPASTPDVRLQTADRPASLIFDKINVIIRRRINSIVSAFIDIGNKRHITDDDFFENEVQWRELFWKSKWPQEAQAACCFHLDDLCTKSRNIAAFDYGGEPSEGVAKAIEDILIRHPKIKITAFVIPAPTFVADNQTNGTTHHEDTYDMRNARFGTWRKWLHRLEKTRRVEIANHGLHHIQTDRKHILPYAEFEFKDKTACMKTLIKSQDIFKATGFTPIGFKPSSWGVGHNTRFALVDSLKTLDNHEKKGIFTYVCLSSPTSGLNWDIKRVSNIFPCDFQGLTHIPQNINLNWPIDIITRRVNRIVEMGGLVAIQAHANIQGTWMSDGLGTEVNQKIDHIIKILSNKKIVYLTLAQVAQIFAENRNKSR